MNHDEKIAACRAIFNTCLEVLDAKGRDYSGTEDGMGNFKDFGWKGIVVRLGDKYHRLKNLTKAEATVNESVEDTLYDTINYAALALVMKAIETDPKSYIKLGAKFENLTCEQCDKICNLIEKHFYKITLDNQNVV